MRHFRIAWPTVLAAVGCTTLLFACNATQNAICSESLDLMSSHACAGEITDTAFSGTECYPDTECQGSNDGDDYYKQKYGYIYAKPEQQLGNEMSTDTSTDASTDTGTDAGKDETEAGDGEETHEEQATISDQKQDETDAEVANNEDADNEMANDDTADDAADVASQDIADHDVDNDANVSHDDDELDSDAMDESDIDEDNEPGPIDGTVPTEHGEKTESYIYQYEEADESDVTDTVAQDTVEPDTVEPETQTNSSEAMGQHDSDDVSGYPEYMEYGVRVYEFQYSEPEATESTKDFDSQETDSPDSDSEAATATPNSEGSDSDGYDYEFSYSEAMNIDNESENEDSESIESQEPESLEADAADSQDMEAEDTGTQDAGTQDVESTKQDFYDYESQYPQSMDYESDEEDSESSQPQEPESVETDNVDSQETKTPDAEAQKTGTEDAEVEDSKTEDNKSMDDESMEFYESQDDDSQNTTQSTEADGYGFTYALPEDMYGSSIEPSTDIVAIEELMKQTQNNSSQYSDDQYTGSPYTTEYPGEFENNEHLALFTWDPAELLTWSDQETLRVLAIIPEQAAGVRRAALSDYLESLGLEATELANRFEEESGLVVLSLADDLAQTAAFLACFRLSERGELESDEALTLLRKSFLHRSDRWNGWIDEITGNESDVSTSDDAPQTDKSTADTSTANPLLRAVVRTAAGSLESLGGRIVGLSRQMKKLY